MRHAALPFGGGEPGSVWFSTFDGAEMDSRLGVSTVSAGIGDFRETDVTPAEEAGFPGGS